MRVLVVRVGAMGDVLHALPAVAALREAMPDVYLGWVIEPRWKALLESDDGQRPMVDKVHLAATREWKLRPSSLATLRAIAGLRRELRAERYDLCVDLQGSIRSAVIGRMTGAKAFVGPKTPREAPAAIWYGRRIELQAEHVIAQGCELLGAGVGMVLEPARVAMPVDAQAEENLREVGEGFCLLSPGAGWGAKEWGAAKYRELQDVLERSGRRVVVNDGSCTVAELIALTRRAEVVIGGDTGPVHLAAALGRPVVALFGPTDPARNGPQGFPGARVKMVRHETSRTSHKRNQETEAGLAKIGVDEVLSAVEEMLKETKRDG